MRTQLIRAALHRRSLLGLLVAALAMSNMSSSVAVGVEEIASFADHDAERYLRIDLGTSSATEGNMLFVDADDGLFWSAAPLTVVTETDGSISVSYSGAGWTSPDAAFDPNTWLLQLGATINPVTTLQVSGTISAARTAASISLSADATPYVLDDEAAGPGAATAVTEIIDDLDAADWAAVYARMHVTATGGLSESQFVAAMSGAMAGFGSLVSVAAVGSLTTGENGSGWDLAHQDVAVTMQRNGCEMAYPSSVDAVYDGSWLIGSLGGLEADGVAPSSAAETVEEFYGPTTTEISVPFSVDADPSGICRVELWWRHRGAPGGWSAWALGPVGVSSPLSFAFEAGPGTYELHTRAVDNAGNIEDPPAAADMVTELDPPSGWSVGSDAFGRNIGSGSGWGSADAGGGWTVINQSSASVNTTATGVDGAAAYYAATGGTNKVARLDALDVADSDIGLRFTLSALPASGTHDVGAVGRFVDYQTYYFAQAMVDAVGLVKVRIYKRVTGANIALSSAVSTGLTVSAGSSIRLRAQFDGSSPTTVRVRAWLDGTPEPGTWTATATDSEAELQAANPPGLLLGPSSAVTISVDDVDVETMLHSVGSDTFARTIGSGSGWGTADAGGAWTIINQSSSAVNTTATGVDGALAYYAATGGTDKVARLDGLDVRGADVSFGFRLSSLPAAGSHAVGAVGRFVDNGNFYFAHALVEPSGSVKVRIYRRAGGSSSALTTAIATGLTVEADTLVWLRAQFEGASPTTIKVRAWLDGSPEPSTWTATATDSEANLQVANAPGIRMAPNSAVTVSVDDVWILAVR